MGFRFVLEISSASTFASFFDPYWWAIIVSHVAAWPFGLLPSLSLQIERFPLSSAAFSLQDALAQLEPRVIKYIPNISISSDIHGHTQKPSFLVSKWIQFWYVLTSFDPPDKPPGAGIHVNGGGRSTGRDCRYWPPLIFRWTIGCLVVFKVECRLYHLYFNDALHCVGWPTTM